MRKWRVTKWEGRRSLSTEEEIGVFGADHPFDALYQVVDFEGGAYQLNPAYLGASVEDPRVGPDYDRNFQAEEVRDYDSEEEAERWLNQPLSEKDAEEWAASLA